MIDINEHAIEVFGNGRQIDQSIEEFGELIVALSHYRRNRIGIDNVIEEIADCSIMIDQLSLIFGSKLVNEIKLKKIARLGNTIDEYKNK